MSRLPILYIASNGRSGSTVLEMLLHTNPRFWTLGEFHVLPWELRTNTKPCGCGDPITKCSFWKPIIDQHRATILRGDISRFRRAYNADRTIRLAEWPALLRGDLAKRTGRRKHVEVYAQDNDRILRAVLDRVRQHFRPNVQWLVDSSKSPYRLMWLAASDQFDLRVIHLMKDPRAFVYSMCKEAEGMRRAFYAARATARWQVENRLLMTAIDNYVPPERVYRLQYELFASSPEKTLEGIADWLSVPQEGSTETFRGEHHGISGNPSRFKSGGIRLDDQWRTQLHPALQWGCWQLTAPLAARFGYKAANGNSKA